MGGCRKCEPDPKGGEREYIISWNRNSFIQKNLLYSRCKETFWLLLRNKRVYLTSYILHILHLLQIIHTLSRSMTCFGMSTSVKESSGPETILPFMYIMPPEPKTELCNEKEFRIIQNLKATERKQRKSKENLKGKLTNVKMLNCLKIDITLAALVRIFGYIILICIFCSACCTQLSIGKL